MKAIQISGLFGVLFISAQICSEAQTTAALHSGTAGGNVAPSSSETLSPVEWQEIREARMAAIKADPSLMAKAAQLNEKLRQFERKLDEAMIKTDPRIASVLAKFGANRPLPQHPVAQPPPKPQ